MAVTRPAASARGAQPAHVRAAEMLGDWLAGMAPGQRLPSEPELARHLGVSRSTLREAMRLFEARGRIVRRPRVGTVVAGSHPVIDAGLEVLESLDTLARRQGLRTEMADQSITEAPADAKVAAALGLTAGEKVLLIARTVLAAGVPVAYLVDALPCGLVTSEELRGYTGSVLDLLVRRGEPPLGQSHTTIMAEMAEADLARRLGLHRGAALIHLEAVLYALDGRPLDHSHSYFAPGYFKFHVVRRVAH